MVRLPCVNHVPEHLSTMSPVCTLCRGGGQGEGRCVEVYIRRRAQQSSAPTEDTPAIARCALGWFHGGEAAKGRVK